MGLVTGALKKLAHQPCVCLPIVFSLERLRFPLSLPMGKKHAWLSVNKNVGVARMMGDAYSLDVPPSLAV